jgi:hypothetical protein
MLEMLDIPAYTQSLLDWAEKHAGLAGWAGVLVAIIGILVVWRLREKRIQKQRERERLDRFKRITTELQTIVVDFLRLVDAKDHAAINYARIRSHDARWSRGENLNRMPVIQWPSIESYDSFRLYFQAASGLLETPAFDTPEVMESRRRAFEGKFETLQNALDQARK